jgi:thioredoxin-like negative regulator of GroEL
MAILPAVTGCGSKPASDPSSEQAGHIVFSENDYARALATAKRTKKPLFVDAWAPWCHTCLSMRSYVFDDPVMKPLAGQFVWLAMNTETPPGEEFVQKFPMSNWPTLWVIDPTSQTPLVKWVGSATATELSAVLGDLTNKQPGAGAADGAKIAGDHASATGDAVGAIADYRVALSKSPKGWPARPRVAEALSMRFYETKAYRDAVLLADQELGTMPKGTSKANVALNALIGAEELPENDPARNLGARRATVEQIARDMTVPMLADDRSSLFEALVDLAKERHEDDETQRIAQPWSEFLDAQAAAAPNAQARAVFDAHRTEAYLALKTPEKAVAMLQTSEREFPEDYNPPARLARALFAAGRKDEAMASIDRALELVYGPRTLRLYLSKADMQHEMGDRKGEEATLQKALAAASMGGVSKETALAVSRRLDKLQTSAESPTSE